MVKVPINPAMLLFLGALAPNLGALKKPQRTWKPLSKASQVEHVLAMPTPWLLHMAIGSGEMGMFALI